MDTFLIIWVMLWYTRINGENYRNIRKCVKVLAIDTYCIS